ncbi:hypothetical protein ADUPG1_014710, partial [Aduncisulcus paluster]
MMEELEQMIAFGKLYENWYQKHFSMKH